TTLSPIQPTLTQPESSRTIPVNRDGEVIDRMMRRVTSRVATARQRLILLQLLEEQRQDFQQEPGAARTLLKLEVTPENSPVPDRPSESAGSGSLASDQDVDLGPIKITVPELAAWTSVAHVILSLPAAVELP
ncbi:MAG: hypothetical protein ACKPEY_22145, partial [Planctomycetota bacterium]